LLEKEDLAYERMAAQAKAEYESKLTQLAQSRDYRKAELKSNTDAYVKNTEQDISKIEASISNKETEISNIDELQEQAVKAIDEKTAEQIKTIEAEAGNSKNILDTMQEIPIEPLKKAADEVAEMQSYLRDYDLMKDILLNKIAPRTELSAAYTSKIETARKLPLELLKTSKCPIDGVSVDDKGLLRINGTLINGLSDGEMKDLAVRIAKNRAEAGNLRIICFDGFQDINPTEQQKIIEEAKKDGFMWFFLRTTDSDLTIEIIDNGEVNNNG
jgi:hypothetical protein